MSGFALYGKDGPPNDYRLTAGDTWAIFVLAVLGALVAAMVAAATNLETGTGIAVSDFFKHFIEGEPFKPKSLMYVTGLICALGYFFVYYFYICAYIDRIWNNYFVQKGDRALLYYMSAIQMITSGFLVFIPHYWWVFVLLFHLQVCAVFGYRYSRFRRAIKAKGLLVTDWPPTINAAASKAAEYDRLLTQLYLFRSGVRSLLAKYPLYYGPFLLTIFSAHAVHHTLGRAESMGYETLVVGMYVAASLLFLITSFVDYTIKSFWLLDTLKDRADANDHSYFDGFLR
jgi:hypothetical protein